MKNQKFLCTVIKFILFVSPKISELSQGHCPPDFGAVDIY